jgi:hypothetical protein
MNQKSHFTNSIFLFLLAVLFILAGCSGSSSSTTDLSNITELSAASKDINASQGGTITHSEFTVNFPADILPFDAQMRVSKVFVSNSKQDSSLIDITGTYILSTSSTTHDIELDASASIALKINPAGFDAASIRLVVWDGYEWEEVPSSYDGTLRVVSSTVRAILPFGTRIYLANPEASSTDEREGGEQVVSEFVAMKVVGEISGSPRAQHTSANGVVLQSTAVIPGRAVFIKSPKGKFTVNYVQVKDPAEADALKKKADDIAVFMDNAYDTIVTGMGLKSPDLCTEPGYEDTYPVKLRVIKGAYGSADPGTNSIYLSINESPGDGLAHTGHHEFTHLVQFKTLDDANHKISDSLDWFGETMADAVGYYAQKGRGTIYCLAGESMGYFYVRLDADNHSMGNENNNYEYRHFPFISYLLDQYKEAKFKKFFETWYSYPGSKGIEMNTIDNAATTTGSLGKAISGRDGIFWDFYRDYFISGIVFNRDKFKNLPDRDGGKPFDIKEDNKAKQGVTIVEIGSTTSSQKDFTMQQLSGQVLIYRYKGSSENPVGLNVTVNSTPGNSVGRIQVLSFKRVGGVLQPPVTTEEVTDGGQKSFTYSGFGRDISDIYILMTNTSFQTNDYKVRVEASIIP